MTERLKSLAESNNKEVTGRSLMVLKNALIAQAMDDAGMQTTGTKEVTKVCNANASNAGSESADKVRLRQEADQKKTLLLGAN